MRSNRRNKLQWMIFQAVARDLTVRQIAFHAIVVGPANQRDYTVASWEYLNPCCIDHGWLNARVGGSDHRCGPPTRYKIDTLMRRLDVRLKVPEQKIREDIPHHLRIVRVGNENKAKAIEVLASAPAQSNFR